MNAEPETPGTDETKVLRVITRTYVGLVTAFLIASVLLLLATVGAPGVFSNTVAGKAQRDVDQRMDQIEDATRQPEAYDYPNTVDVAAVQDEIASYRANPRAYIAAAMHAYSHAAGAPEHRAHDALPTTPETIRQAIGQRVVERQTIFLADLGACAGTNAILALLALGIQRYTRGTPRIVGALLFVLMLPGIIVASIVFHGMLGETGIRIGWVYPLLLCVPAIGIGGSFLGEYLLHNEMRKEEERYLNTAEEQP